jgi:chemotaxis protein histidine kinase CheA
VHGIEPPETRAAAGKPTAGVIHVSGVEGKLGPVVTVEDDGQGMDMALIAERAVALGQDAARVLPAQELAFLPGLSTARRPGDLAGRGVGLYAVRSELASVGYAVEVFSRPGELTRFVLKPSGAPGEHEVQMKDAHA